MAVSESEDEPSTTKCQMSPPPVVFAGHLLYMEIWGQQQPLPASPVSTHLCVRHRSQQLGGWLFGGCVVFPWKEIKKGTIAYVHSCPPCEGVNPGLLTWFGYVYPLHLSS